MSDPVETFGPGSVLTGDDVLKVDEKVLFLSDYDEASLESLQSHIAMNRASLAEIDARAERFRSLARMYDSIGTLVDQVSQVVSIAIPMARSVAEEMFLLKKKDK